MSLGLYNVESPLGKAMGAQAGAQGTFAQMQKQQETTTQRGIGETISSAGSGALMGAGIATAVGLAVPGGAIVGGLLGLLF